MMELRKLNPDADRALIAQSLAWLADTPRWFRDADRAWGETDLDSYCGQMRTDPQIDLGVFEDESMIAVITLCLITTGVFNAHITCQRKASVDTLIIALLNVRRQIFQQGATGVHAWTLRQNRGLKRILEAAGMRRDGLVRYRGSSHGRLLEWQRHSVEAV